MAGYQDEDNEKLAGEIKKLNRDYLLTGDVKFLIRAQELSSNLLRYFQYNYPDNFKTLILYMPEKINIKEIPRFLASKKIDPIKNLHDILIIGKVINIMHGFGDSERSLDIFYTGFIDEGGIHLRDVKSYCLYMPPEFYEFLDRIGISLQQASELYKLNQDRTIPWVFQPSNFQTGTKKLD